MNADAKKAVLRMIPYGVYALTADDAKGNIAAATDNWVTQIAFAPPLVFAGRRDAAILEMKDLGDNVLYGGLKAGPGEIDAAVGCAKARPSESRVSMRFICMRAVRTRSRRRLLSADAWAGRQGAGEANGFNGPLSRGPHEHHGADNHSDRSRRQAAARSASTRPE